jgi:hypothetical protein
MGRANYKDGRRRRRRANCIHVFSPFLVWFGGVGLGEFFAGLLLAVVDGSRHNLNWQKKKAISCVVVVSVHD